MKDLVIVGSGPGGYIAAIRAAQLGMSVACVEKAELGGICTNWGCIPTKALLHTAALLDELEDADDLGVHVERVQPEFGKIIQRSRKVAERNSKGVEFLFKKNKIEWVRGTAKLEKGGAVSVDGKQLEAKHVILATGARPKPLPFLEHDGKQILSYKEAMALQAQPKSLLIIGAGAIGVEFASFYHACGTKVTLVEALPNIVPAEDDEVANALAKILAKQGIEIIAGAKLSSVEKGPPVRAQLTDAKGQARTVEADLCLLATGVRGNVEGLGLEEAGVKVERGFISVDKQYRTSLPNVFAIGDVIGPPMLAHKAMSEAVVCVEQIAGHKPQPINYGAIPGGTFCHPEVASVGLTEKKAKELGLKFKVGRFPFIANGRARATSSTDGFVKVLVGEPHGEILGAHILGGTSTDMLATLTVAMTAELTADEIRSTVFMHPTFSEAMKGAVEDAYGEALDL